MRNTKLLSLLLILALTLSAVLPLTSCGDTQGNGSYTKADTDDDVWYKDLDFKGKTLTISQSIHRRGSNTTDPSPIDNAEKYTRGPSAIGPDDVLNMCYNRNNDVKQLLGITVEYEETNLQYNEIGGYLETLTALSTSRGGDIIINDVYAVVPATLKGQLYNLADTKSTDNYLDLTHTSWYRDYIYGLTLDENKVYAVAGDYFIDVLRSAHCLYVNTERFLENCGILYTSLDDFYTMIASGGWTFDEMTLLTELGWLSTQGTVTANVDDDCIGYYCANNFSIFPYAFASDIEYVVKNTATGQYEITQNARRLADFTEDLDKLFYSSGTLYDAGLPDLRTAFTEGRALFVGGFWLGDLEHTEFYQMENKATVAYPKWNESVTEYKTYVHDSAEIGYLPKNCTDVTLATAYLQLINEMSTDIISEYFQYALKYKYSTDSEALAMMDIIHDTIASPFSQLICNQVTATGSTSAACYGGLVVTAIQAHTPSTAYNTFESCKTAFEVSLSELINKFKTLD